MGYTWMVDLDQEADFVGKQALQRIKAEGPTQARGVEIDGPSLGSFITTRLSTCPLFDGAADRPSRRPATRQAREEHRVRDASYRGTPTWAAGSKSRIRPVAGSGP